MEFLNTLIHEFNARFAIDAKLDAVKEWLKRDEYKMQRRLTLAVSTFVLAAIVLLLTNCSGGPQINP